MSNTHLFSGSIPANYDKYLGPYLFEPYALDLKERLKDDDCKTVLELACGTGRVTKHLVEILNEDGKLIATDINNDMLLIAKTVVHDKRVEWHAVDAQELSFPDATFDHVICQYGVMFFPDKPRAFKEAYRVLINGGKFVFNTWGSLNDNRRAGLIHEVLKDIFKDDAPEFLQHGPYSFYNSEVIKSLLSTAGFKNISKEPVKKVVKYKDIEDYMKGFLTGTPLSAFLQKQDSSKRDEVYQTLKEANQQQFGSSTRSEMLAYVCTAEKE